MASAEATRLQHADDFPSLWYSHARGDADWASPSTIDARFLTHEDQAYGRGHLKKDRAVELYCHLLPEVGESFLTPPIKADVMKSL